MFSALNEKVERLEKENEDLKARLSAIEARLVEKTNQEDSKRVEEMLDERLGHTVCVGTSIEQNALFKNVNDFLTYDPEHPDYVTGNLLRGCSVFYVESLKFFPIFAKIGFEMSKLTSSVRLHGGLEFGNPYPTNQQGITRKYDNFDVFCEACLKYNVHLLFNGQKIDDDPIHNDSIVDSITVNSAIVQTVPKQVKLIQGRNCLNDDTRWMFFHNGQSSNKLFYRKNGEKFEFLGSYLRMDEIVAPITSSSFSGFLDFRLRFTKTYSNISDELYYLP